MSRKTLLKLIVCGLMAFAVQSKTLFAAAPSLAGSWELTFTPSASPTPLEIPGLGTFTSDGSLVETDGTEVAPGAPASTAAAVATYGTPGHGVWQLLPSLSGFYITYVSLSVNANGSLNSKHVTVATVSLATTTNGVTSFTGTYTTTTTSSSSTPPKTTTGTLTGTLIPHPALP